MKILFACGGTGGHIFPGIALAECFEKKVPGVEIVFVGTTRGLEKEIISKTHWRLEMIQAPSVADKKGFARVAAGFSLLKALREAWCLIRRERPQLVLGVGGYVAVPVLLAAVFRGVPAATLETNAIEGLANRLLKHFVKYFFVSPLGAPVRENLFVPKQPHPSGKKVVLIMGGSQGAKKINEGMLASLPYLQEMKDQIHFVHQVGRQTDAASVAAAYRAHGFSSEVTPFIDAMGEAYAKADFVIARSGANTVAELAALGKPSLLIPFPFSAARHQEANARSLESQGGAKVLSESEASGKNIARFLKELLGSPEELRNMEKKLDGVGSQQAAERIVEECIKNIDISIS